MDALSPIMLMNWLVALDAIPEDQRMTSMQDLIEAAKQTKAEHERVLAEIEGLRHTATGRMYLEKSPLEEAATQPPRLSLEEAELLRVQAEVHQKSVNRQIREVGEATPLEEYEKPDELLERVREAYDKTRDDKGRWTL